MHKIRLALGLTLAIAVGLFPSSAPAQVDASAIVEVVPPAAPATVPVSLPAAAPVPMDDPAQLASRAVTAADQGDWRVLAVALLALCGFLLRNKTSTEGKLGAFLHSKRGALLVSAFSAAIGSAVPSLQGGATVRAVVISAVASAVGALMGWLTPAPKVAAAGGAVVLAVLFLGGAAHAEELAPLDGATSGVAIVGSGVNLRDSNFYIRTLGCQSCLVAQLDPSRAQLAADTRAQPAATPQQTDAEKAVAVIAALNAAAQSAQSGVANAPPVLKSWAETRAGQIVMGCIAGAIIITSAAGAAAGVIVSLQ